MENTTAYVSNVTENEPQRARPLLTLSKRPQLPTTTQEITSYINQHLTHDEQSVCDRATD
jgi:hypothetical protein